MTPTFIRLLLKEPKIRLRAASTGGEIVSDVYTDRFDIYNVYGPSEFGFPTCLFRLDHAYRNTLIGTPFCGSDTKNHPVLGTESRNTTLTAVREKSTIETS